MEIEMDRDEIIKLASQAIDDTRSAVSLPIPFVMRFAVLIAAAERAKLEKQKPVAYLTADKNMLVFADKCVDMQHLMTPLYAATPVTAPVRLTDRDKDDLAAPYSGMGGIEDYRAYAQDIETAALRANGFDIQPARGEG